MNKRSMMLLLLGFLSPSGGTAYVNGHDIRTNIEGVRESLGLCPQHDVLFDTLTVHEHLEFFAKVSCGHVLTRPFLVTDSSAI